MKRNTIAFLLLAAICILLMLAGCTVPDGKAQRVLQGAGYTDIHLHGRAWFDCSEDDTRATSFTAKGPHGQPVKGAVCCGAFAKNCTIRLD